MKNKIKKIPYILLVAFILYSCGPDMVKPKPKYVTYEITNQTNYTVKFVPFNRQGKMESISITPRSSFKGREKRGSLTYIFSLTDAISKKEEFLKKVVIIFDDKKKIEYEPCEKPRCNNSRNIFDAQYNSGTTFNISYKITEADYKAATDCNGKCE